MQVAAASASQRAARPEKKRRIANSIGGPVRDHVLYDRMRDASLEQEGIIADLILVRTRGLVQHDHCYARRVKVFETASGNILPNGNSFFLAINPKLSTVPLATLQGQETHKMGAAAPSAIQPAASPEKEGKIAGLMGDPCCSHVQLDVGCDRCAASFIAELGTVGELVPLTLEPTDFLAFLEEENRTRDRVEFREPIVSQQHLGEKRMEVEECGMQGMQV